MLATMPRPPNPNKPSKRCKCKRDSMDKTLFIAEVYKRRELWDKRLGHINRDLINNLWLEVGTAMGLAAVTDFEKRKLGTSLRVKWKNLKDAYRKEAKRVLDEPGYLPKWLHFGNLMFLNNQFDFKTEKEPHCSVNLATQFHFEETFKEDESREEFSHNEESVEDPLINEDTDIIFVKEEVEEYSFTEEPSTTTEININKEKPKKEVPKHEEQKSSSNRSSGLMDEETDADMYFFKSLVLHMKKLKPQQRMELKIKIHELVFDSVYRKNQ